MLNLRKKIRIWLQRQSLRRDAERALSCASKVYWDQLSLPEELRDNTLIDESLSVIKCASSMLAEGASMARTRLFSSSGALRRVVTVALTCILVIALSAGAAYAMGVDVWQMLFASKDGHSALYTNPDNNYDAEITPTISVKPMDDFQDYNDVASACESLGISPMLIDEKVSSLTVTDVYGMAAESSITLFVDYSQVSNTLNYMTVRYPDTNTAGLLTAEGFDSAAKAEVINDITFYIVTQGNETLVMWSHDRYAYQITTDINMAQLMEILQKLN